MTTTMDTTTHPIDSRTRARRIQMAIRWGVKIKSMVDGAKYNQDVWSAKPGYHLCLVTMKVSPSSVHDASQCGFEGCFAGWLDIHPRLKNLIGNLNGHGEPYSHLSRVFGIERGEASYVFRSARTCEDPHDPDLAVRRLVKVAMRYGIKIPKEARYLIDEQPPVLDETAIDV